MPEGKRASKRPKSRRNRARGFDKKAGAPKTQRAAKESEPRSNNASRSRSNNNNNNQKGDDYLIEIRFDRNKRTYIGTVAEIPQLSAEATDREEVFRAMEDAIEDHLVELKSRGKKIPEALYNKKYPESLSLRLSQGLYRKLDLLSRRERVDLDKLVVELISSAVERRGEKSGRQNAGNQPQGQRDNSNNNMNKRQRPNRDKQRGGYNNYHQTMDSRENFMDYVRRLEKGRK